MNSAQPALPYTPPTIKSEQELSDLCSSSAFEVLHPDDSDACKGIREWTVATVEHVQSTQGLTPNNHKNYWWDVALVGLSLIVAWMVWRFKKPILDILNKKWLTQGNNLDRSYYSNTPDPTMKARIDVYEPSGIIKAIGDIIAGARLEHTTPEENLQYWLDHEKKQLDDNPDALVKILSHLIEEIEKVWVNTTTVKRSKDILVKLSLPESKETEWFDKLDDGTKLLLTILFGIMERASAPPTQSPAASVTPDIDSPEWTV